MKNKVSWNWASISLWIIVALIVLDRIYWTIVGIYIASVDNQNLEPITFGAMHIAVLVAVVTTSWFIFESDTSWWDMGFETWSQVLMLWIVFFFLMIMDLFVMLVDIFDPKPTSTTDQNLIISVGAIDLTFTTLAFVWSLVVGIVILIYHGVTHMHYTIYNDPVHGKMLVPAHMVSQSGTASAIGSARGAVSGNQLATAYGSPSASMVSSGAAFAAGGFPASPTVMGPGMRTRSHVGQQPRRAASTGGGIQFTNYGGPASAAASPW